MRYIQIYGVAVSAGGPCMLERVVFPFRGRAIGGSHVATFTLATAIQQRSDVECVVVCSQDTAIMREAERLGLRVEISGELPTTRNSALTDATWIGKRRHVLRRACGERKAIVHCNDINTLRAWGLPARLNGIGVVYHHHAMNRMWWPPHLLSLTYANSVVCVSDSTLASLRRFRPDATKELNPFNIDRTTSRSSARQSLLAEFGWPEDAIVVGWVGNFWRRKRPEFFLDTAAVLAARDARYRFVMFGRGADFSVPDIESLAHTKGLRQRVETAGFRQPAENNLAALDLLLAPAPREPFGRTLVEAIMLGTPIVATRGAGHSEIINAWGGGMLAREDASPARVADLCTTVLATPDKYRIAAARIDEISDQLSSAASARRILALYGQIIGSTKPRGASLRPLTQGRRKWL